ncbi:hypothetical protein ACP70R_004062 [Stipagrostis hirtigluma subsp. patula]
MVPTLGGTPLKTQSFRCFQDDRLVEAWTYQLLDLIMCSFPPADEGFVGRMRRQSSKTKSAKKEEPELPGYHTREEQVVDCLLVLVIERAAFRVWKTSARQSI